MKKARRDTVGKLKAPRANGREKNIEAEQPERDVGAIAMTTRAERERPDRKSEFIGAFRSALGSFPGIPRRSGENGLKKPFISGAPPPSRPPRMPPANREKLK